MVQKECCAELDLTIEAPKKIVGFSRHSFCAITRIFSVKWCSLVFLRHLFQNVFRRYPAGLLTTIKYQVLDVRL